MDLQQNSILLVFLVSLCLVLTIAQNIQVQKSNNKVVIFDPVSGKEIVPLDYAPTKKNITKKKGNLITLPKRTASVLSVLIENFVLLPQLWSPCRCNSLSCHCCVGLRFTYANSSKNALCISLTSKRPLVGVNIRIDFNEIITASHDIVADNITPGCLPLAFLGLPLSGCLRISQLKFQENGDIEFCISLDLKLIFHTIFAFNFNCFRFGTNGIEMLPFNKDNTTKKPSWFGRK